MQAKRDEQQQARRLRREGKSVRAIASTLGVSVSSVSVWVRDIPRPVAPPPCPSPEPEPDTTPFRRCSRCREVLPATAFNRNTTGRQWWCRECFKAYFRERGPQHLEQVSRAKRRRREEGRAFVMRYLETNPCVDCGETDPAVLEFDHLRDKRAAVSALRAEATGCPGLAEEIVKCEVVCANCHRWRTARRGGWWRLNPEGPPPACLDKYQVRNLRHAHAVLNASGCVDCGRSDLVVLDFDHIGPKSESVMCLARRGCSLDRLDKEIGQCEVRCANCHRRRTITGRRAA